jgi:hypothetical protein
MEWILIIVGIIFLIAVYYIKLQKSGNLSFWTIANKHSLWAYDYFMEHSDGWYIICPGEAKGKPAGDWTGPFFLSVPEIGMITIYGKVGIFEAQQEEFKRITRMYDTATNIRTVLDYETQKDNQINFNDLYEQYEYKEFGCLVLYYAKYQSLDNLTLAFMEISSYENKNEEEFIDIINNNAYDESFWTRPCFHAFSFVREMYKMTINNKADDRELFNIFNIIVLNFAISTIEHPEVGKFIKKSIT